MYSFKVLNWVCFYMANNTGQGGWYNADICKYNHTKAVGRFENMATFNVPSGDDVKIAKYWLDNWPCEHISLKKKDKLLTL